MLVVSQLIIDSIKKDLPGGRSLNLICFSTLSYSWRVRGPAGYRFIQINIAIPDFDVKSATCV